MKDLQTRVLRTLRNPKLVNGIGLTLVALVGLWLVVNFIKGPQEFVNVALDGLTRGSMYALVALGYTLVYGILELINFAHGDVFMLGGMMAVTVVGTTLFDLTQGEAWYVLWPLIIAALLICMGSVIL